MRTFGSALVTGATGFIGSALVNKLSSQNFDVTCLVRSRDRAVPLANLPGVQIIETSFHRRDLAEKLADVSFDVVFNLAAYGVRQQDRDSQQLLDGNVRLLADLLEVTSTRNLRRFIHAGTCSEYRLPVADGCLVEESHALGSISPYGAAKVAAGFLGNSLAAKLRVPLVTLRLFGVFGPHEGPDRLIPYLIERLRNNQSVDLTPGEQVRDFLFEDDVAAAFIEAGSAPALTALEAYNVCSSRPVRIREVGHAIADALQKPHDLLHWGEREYRDDEPMWLVGNNRRFVEATSWRPTVGMEAGIQRVVSSILGSTTSGERQGGI